MIPIIDINDDNLIVNKDFIYQNACESETHKAIYNNEPKIIKTFPEERSLGYEIRKRSNYIENKIKKIKLIKERNKNIDTIVTADAFIKKDDQIIGYIMPEIKGINIYYNSLSYKRKKDFLIWYLKEIKKQLERIHELNIITADFPGNIILKDNKLYFIDHDNFMIDNYPVDLENNFLKKYISRNISIDKNFDYYLLNLYTISLFKNIHFPYMYESFYGNRDMYDFKDPEIKQIFEDTLTFKKIDPENLIIDKINTPKDLKKIKSKIF